MPAPGQALFSTEIFGAINGTCPHTLDSMALFTGEHGLHFAERAPLVLYSIPYALFWWLLRRLLKASLPDIISSITGIKGRPKMRSKIAYQAWLMLYYTVSTSLGVWGYWDRPWFQFPPGHDACVATFGNHPPTLENGGLTPFMEWSYQFQLGFYFAELFAIFNETRRSDFTEYVVHHLVTILLVMHSSLALLTRVGCFIFFIHDVSDIFLCGAKIFNYLKKELLANTIFALFVISFFFLRLVCFPAMSYCIFCHAPSVFGATTQSFVFLAWLLSAVLQSLHIFWFALTIRMIVRLAMGVRADVRSDNDEPEDEAAVTIAGDAPGARGSSSTNRLDSKKNK